MEILNQIINKDHRVVYLASLNNGNFCVEIFEKLKTVIRVNPNRLDIILRNINQPLMAFAECKERGVAELSMDLIGELIKNIFSFKEKDSDKARINELIQNALQLFTDLIDLRSENIVELTVNKI